VNVENQNGVLAFDVQYAQEGTGGVPGPWTLMTLTSSKKVTISGLTPAGTYQFQVRALGKQCYHRGHTCVLYGFLYGLALLAFLEFQ